MTGNYNLLFDIKSICGGFVSFAGKNGGYITGEGTVTNGVVSFDRVNYIKEVDYNLLSVSQICDKKFTVMFDDKACYILNQGFKIPEDAVMLSAPRVNDLYMLDMSQAVTRSAQATCFVTKATERDSIAWHRRMGHIHLRKMNHLIKNNLVEGVSVKSFHLQDDCVACKKGKQTRNPHPKKKHNSIITPLELLHMDLFGPIKRKSITGEYYCLVVTDDYSRFSWVSFMEHKSQTFDHLKILIPKLESLYKLKVRRIRSDNGGEFKNKQMEDFCQENVIHHEFSAPYTPQQNGVAERKNEH